MPTHDPFSPKSNATPPVDGTSPTDSVVTPTEPTQDGETGSATLTDDNAATEQADNVVEVPAGTTREVLTWVGDDRSRAQAALDVEHASDEPRKGLTHELEELLRDDSSES